MPARPTEVAGPNPRNEYRSPAMDGVVARDNREPQRGKHRHMGQINQDLLHDAVAIRSEDQLLLSKGYGYADIERQIPMTAEHIFRIASHSKTFTATAIMQ